jgi:FkbM family methyltransferase
VIRLGNPGTVNRIAKRVTPALGSAISGMGAVSATELLASYLNLLAGKGCGTGWDKGEEAAAAEIIRERTQADPIVIDCGANRGEWIRGVRRQLGSDKGTWIAIEPNPGCATFLQQVSNLEVIQAAAGESHGSQMLWAPDVTSCLASLHQRGDTVARGHEFTARKVEVLTLDSVIANKGLKRIDFLKMDIEGHELFALKGTMTALRQGYIRALSFEFGAGNVNSRTFFRDFWDLLTPLGFELRRICPGGVTVPVREYYEDLEFFRGVSNYIGTLVSKLADEPVRWH